MDAFEFSALVHEQARSGRAYLEFLRVPSMSMGLYVLPAGGVDPQQPHAEDEAYYIVEGRGMINLAGEEQMVQAGSLVYVATGVKHHFYAITETLKILVFFAPAETN